MASDAHHPFDALAQRLTRAGECFELVPAKAASKNARRRFEKAAPKRARLLDEMDGLWGAALRWRDGELYFMPLTNVVSNEERADEGRTLLGVGRGHFGVYQRLYGTEAGLELDVDCTLSDRRATVVLPVDLAGYTELAMAHAGVPLWDVACFASAALGLEVSAVALRAELEALLAGALNAPDWSEACARLGGPWWPKRRPVEGGPRLAASTQIAFELAGMAAPPSLARLYAALFASANAKAMGARLGVGRALDVSWKYGHWSLPLMHELIGRSSRVGVYLQGRAPAGSEKMLHFIRSELDVFLDLREGEARPFLWDYSAGEVIPIALDLDAFLSRLFACGGLDGWPREFVAGAERMRSTSERIALLASVVPDLDAFLDGTRRL